jgi:hypothetical protein
MTPLEKEIERKLVSIVKKHGGRCEKLVNVGFSGFPDRTLLFPGEKVVFVETKRPKGSKVAALQKKWREWLTAMGFSVWHIYNYDQLNTFELVLMDELARRH